MSWRCRDAMKYGSWTLTLLPAAPAADADAGDVDRCARSHSATSTHTHTRRYSHVAANYWSHLLQTTYRIRPASRQSTAPPCGLRGERPLRYRSDHVHYLASNYIYQPAGIETRLSTPTYTTLLSSYCCSFELDHISNSVGYMIFHYTWPSKICIFLVKKNKNLKFGLLRFLLFLWKPKKAGC